jgi:aminoglycoside phosphotransferase (APT) family kinase protein
VAAAAGARRVRRVVTHQVSVDHEGQVVVKRYVDSHRGEPAREWRALRLLAEHAPRLAPEPITADLDASPPCIVMSLLPGEPLGGRPLTAPQEGALAVAVGQLWQAVPVELVAPVPGEVDTRAELVQVVSDRLASVDPGPDAAVRDALASAAAWLAGTTVLAAAAGAGRVDDSMPRVLGQGDANLANFLWDGELVRIVDFEDSGVSDRAFELAVLVEHVSAWRDAGLDADRFIAGFDLSATEQSQLADWRRLLALYWLLRLRRRADAGAIAGQAERLLSLLSDLPRR